MPDSTVNTLLSSIQNPQDLRELAPRDLPLLAGEIRDYLIETVSQTGGHFAANLGTVELTIALHYVFNTPHDRLVWDVGHQTYTHKLLTNRKAYMRTLRQAGGLSGFPKREESPYDTFGVGHSSTSISAALGMALAAQLQQQPYKVAAVIGDGAMTAGMAFEALNHAGDLSANILVILNDNDMSISPNVGGLSNYLARILSGRFYSGMREGSKKMLSAMPPVCELARRAEEHMKGMVVPGTLFEELGFNYIGPIDGHDLCALTRTLQNIYHLSGPQFLHVVTRKGKGYAPAEQNPCAFHGVGQFDRKTGKASIVKPPTPPTYTDVFSAWVCDMARTDEHLIAITPAMREGSGLVTFSEQYPQRYFDVGIAEQHCVTLAAGLACEGMKPVVAIYSTFLQRAYDQLIHDVAIQNLPVLFAIDRAGIVGPDGATHTGSFDISFLLCIPNMLIMAPADENECRQMLYTGFIHAGPAAVRYPRDTGIGVHIEQTMTALEIGKAQLVQKGRGIAFLVFGAVLKPALEAAQLCNATVVNMRFIKPLDESMLREVARQHDTIVTIEENAEIGGAGSAVVQFYQRSGILIRTITIGIPDHFVDHGTRMEILSACGLDSRGIINRLAPYCRSLNGSTAKAS